jgi:hypothetical protein
MKRPYDNATKMPSEFCLENLLQRPQLNPLRGGVYSGTNPPLSGSGSALDYLAAAAVHTGAKDTAAKAAVDGKFNHPIDGIKVHNALLVDLLGI